MSETTEQILAVHYWESKGMTYGSPDRCSCGVGTTPEAGDEDATVRRARAFATHQADAIAAKSEPVTIDREGLARRLSEIGALQDRWHGDEERTAWVNAPLSVVLDQAVALAAQPVTGTVECEPEYQAVCGSWGCRAPECKPKGI